jgi:hypothetical protein
MYSAGPKLASLITEASWQQLLQQESSKQYWKCLEAFVQSEWSTKRVFPGQGNTFRAFNSVPLHKVRVVILGQVGDRRCLLHHLLHSALGTNRMKAKAFVFSTFTMFIQFELCAYSSINPMNMQNL